MKNIKQIFIFDLLSLFIIFTGKWMINKVIQKIDLFYKVR